METTVPATTGGVWKKFDVEDLGNYVPIPKFFVDSLIPRGRGIPASFWKFLFVVWRDILAPGKKNPDGTFPHHHRSKKTARQWSKEIGVRAPAALDYVIALSVSGLFTVEWGWRDVKDKPGVPTTMSYIKQATDRDWCAFVDGMAWLYKAMKKNGWASRGHQTIFEDESASGKTTHYNGSHAFELYLAIKVDAYRAQAGMPLVNVKKIEWLIEHGAGCYTNEGKNIRINMLPSRRGVFRAAEYVRADGACTLFDD